jgi:hypothetical protein
VLLASLGDDRLQRQGDHRSAGVAAGTVLVMAGIFVFTRSAR